MSEVETAVLDMEDLLGELETMLNLKDADAQMEEKLLWILGSVKARLKLLLGGTEPPEELKHIVIEVAIARFNRIGSEGLKSHSVEGETDSYYAGNDFSGYMDEIEAFLDAQSNTKRGRMRFL